MKRTLKQNKKNSQLNCPQFMQPSYKKFFPKGMLFRLKEISNPRVTRARKKQQGQRNKQAHI